MKEESKQNIKLAIIDEMDEVVENARYGTRGGVFPAITDEKKDKLSKLEVEIIDFVKEVFKKGARQDRK